MTPKSPNATSGGNAPKWLLDALHIGKDGKPTADDANKKAPAKKPASTDNSKGYVSAQGLSGLSAGFGGLDLSSSPRIPKKGEGISMDHGIRTIGQDKGTKLLAAHAPKFGTHVAKGPSLHYTDDRSGSSPSRAAGPKPKVAPKVPTPVSMTPSGVVGGDRTYKLS